MRLFKIFLGFAFLFSTTNSFAQMTYGGNMAGSGQWGGMQACPYTPNGGGQNSEMSSLEKRIDELQSIVDDLRDEQTELLDGSHDLLDEDKLPLRPGVREGLAQLLGQATAPCPLPANEAEILGFAEANGVPGATELLKILHSEGGADPDAYCNATSVSATESCMMPVVYTDRSKMQASERSCQRFLDLYKKLEVNAAKAEKEIEKLQKRYDKLEEDEFDRQLKARIDGRPTDGGTEACATCGVAMPEPRSPSWGQIGVAAGLDVLNAFAYYKVGRYVSDKNAALGWSTPPWWAGGLPAPNATMSLFASQGYGGGMGSGSWGCAPGAGYPWGPNGGYGNPHGNMSPYGSCGGAFASPCGGYGGNPSFGGQYGMGGYGPYAGMGGYGGPGMGGIGGGLGFGLGIGPGMGGIGGMYPGMGGIGGMGGMYPGMGGIGGMGGMYPGMGGMYPGMGMGMGGYNPYGGMYPGMGGMLGGQQYQMQMQAMAMAQQRAFQNQQVVTQQMYSLDMEIAQMHQRRQYLQSQLYGGTGMGYGVGAGLGLSFGIGAGIGAGYGYGTGGYGGYPSTIPALPGSTTGAPAR